MGAIPLSSDAWVDFSQDGKLMVARDEEGVRLLEVPSGKVRGSWKESSCWGRLSENSQWLALFSNAGVIRLIDSASGREKHRIAHNGEVSQARFTPEAELLVVACKDGQVRCFNTHDGMETARFEAGAGLRLISPDARLIVSQDEDGKALRAHETIAGHELARTATEGLLSPPQAGTDPVGPMVRTASSRDGRTLAVLGPTGRIRVFDLKRFGERPVLEFPREGPMVLSRDERLFAFADKERRIRVAETATGRNVCTFPHDGPAFPVMFSSDGRMLMTRQGQILRLTEIESRREVARLQLDRPIYRIIDASPDQGALVVCEQGPKIVNIGMTARLLEASSLKEILRFPFGASAGSVWSAQAAVAPKVPTGKEVPDLAHGSPVGDVAFSPDGRTVVMTCPEDGVARVIDTASGSERSRITPGAKPYYAEFSPDGQSLALEVFDNSVRLVDLSSGKERFRLQHQWSKQYMATARPRFSPDGRTLAVAEIEKSGSMLNVWLFHVEGGKELCHVHSGKVWYASHRDVEPLVEHGMAFSPDGRYFAVGSVEGDPVRLFDAATGMELASMHLGRGFAGVAFSPDSRYLAAASHNGFTSLLEIATKQPREASRYGKPVTHLAFSPDSRFLITASEDGTARLTETESGTEIARFDHGEPITQTAIVRGGESLVTSSKQKIKIWQADPEAPFEQLCRTARCDLSPEEWLDLFGTREPFLPISSVQ
jgi:WD40 repeat protein